MDAPLYNQEGKEVGKLELPAKIFGQKPNADLVQQAVVTIQGNMRTPVAHTKGRGEVRGGGKKPWKQKGTGRARHGSSRSPIWVGGGVTHGPSKDKVFARKMNSKMKSKALAVVLSGKFRDGELIFINELALPQNKTKLASGILSKLGKALDRKEFSYKKGNRVLLALPKRDLNIEKSFRNIPIVSVDEVRNLNAYSALSYKHLVFVGGQDSIRELEK